MTKLYTDRFVVNNRAALRVPQSDGVREGEGEGTRERERERERDRERERVGASCWMQCQSAFCALAGVQSPASSLSASRFPPGFLASLPSLPPSCSLSSYAPSAVCLPLFPGTNIDIRQRASDSPITDQPACTRMYRDCLGACLGRTFELVPVCLPRASQAQWPRCSIHLHQPPHRHPRAGPSVYYSWPL